MSDLKNYPEFIELRKRVAKMELDLAANTRSTQRVESNTAQIVEAFQAAEGAFKVLVFLSKLAKVILPLAAVSAAIYITAKSGIVAGLAHLKN